MAFKAASLNLIRLVTGVPDVVLGLASPDPVGFPVGAGLDVIPVLPGEAPVVETVAPGEAPVGEAVVPSKLVDVIVYQLVRV